MQAGAEIQPHRPSTFIVATHFLAEGLRSWIPKPNKKTSVLLPTVAAALALADPPAIVRQVSAQEAPSQDQLYQGPGQATADDIERCDPEKTPILALCFKTADPNNSDPTLEERYLFRKFIAFGGGPIDRAICPDGALNPPGRPEFCELNGALVSSATVADIVDPERATKFANSLATPSEQPAAEPTPAPSPEPVAQPGPEQNITCPPLPTPLKGLLYNGKIARQDRINWATSQATEDIRDISRSEIDKIYPFITWNMEPNSRLQPVVYKCVNGNWEFMLNGPVRITKERVNSWGIPYAIPRDAVLGERAFLWTVNGQGAEEVRFRINP